MQVPSTGAESDSQTASSGVHCVGGVSLSFYVEGVVHRSDTKFNEDFQLKLLFLHLAVFRLHP